MENELQTKTTAAKIASNVKDAPFFLPVQPKLTVNNPNDEYEREADATADKVMRMSNDKVSSNTFFQPAAIQRKCKHCEEEEKRLQKKETPSQSNTVASSTESYISNLSGGKTLSQSERNFFEPRMGYDFSDVRVHTDSSANQSAKDINALAYTHGNNIVFAQNQYRPESNDGRHLMAHELTHVVQQNGSINKKSIVQRSEQCDEEGNCISVDDGIDASFVVPSLPGSQSSPATPESGGGSAMSYGAASIPVLGSTMAKSVANSLRSSARSGAVEDLVESVESGTYSQQSLYTAERLTPDQLVEIAENGTAPELEFSHLESLSSAPQYGGESELGVLTDEVDHLYGHHGGNYSNDPGEFADPDWEVRPESEELFGDSNVQIVDAETEEGMEYLGMTDSSEIAADTAVDVGADVATDVGTDIAADVAADVAADALIDAGVTLSAEELLPLLLLLL